MDKLHIIDDIEIEYRKLYNECKKKYSSTREVKCYKHLLITKYLNLGNRSQFEDPH